MKLIPKFKIGLKIKKAKGGTKVDESLDDGIYLENTKFTLPDQYFVDKANKRIKGQNFKTKQDVINFLKKIGLTGKLLDGDIGGTTMRFYLNFINRLNLSNLPKEGDFREGLGYYSNDTWFSNRGLYDDGRYFYYDNDDELAKYYNFGYTPEEALELSKLPVNNEFYEGKGWYYNGKYYPKRSIVNGRYVYSRSGVPFLRDDGTTLTGVYTNFPLIKDVNSTLFIPGEIYTGTDGRQHRVVSVTTRRVPKSLTGGADRKIIYRPVK